jgi:hypothetical protein
MIMHGAVVGQRDHVMVDFRSKGQGERGAGKGGVWQGVRNGEKENRRWGERGDGA